MRPTAPTALLAWLCLCGGASAGNAEARALLDEAIAGWSHDPPGRILALLDSAEAAQQGGPVLASQILLVRGALHHTRTRELDRAELLYDRALRVLEGAPGPEAAWLRAEGLRRKGNLVVRRDFDCEEGLRLFLAAYAASQSGYDAEVASQLALRLALQATEPERGRMLSEAWRLAQEATRLAQEDLPPGQERREQLAKTWLQQALVLHALGRPGEAARVLGAIPPGDFGQRSLYQRAIYDALAGEPVHSAQRLRAWLATRANPADQRFARDLLAQEPALRERLGPTEWAALGCPPPERPRLTALGAPALGVVLVAIFFVCVTPRPCRRFGWTGRGPP